MTRNSVAAMVISSGGFAVINEWINRGSVEQRCIDDTRESGVVSFTREIHVSRGGQRGRIYGIRRRVCARDRTRYRVSVKPNGMPDDRRQEPRRVESFSKSKISFTFVSDNFKR